MVCRHCIFFMLLRQSREWMARGRWAYGVVVIAFGASRLMYAASGVRFDISFLDYAWQYLDPVLLRERLFESLLYMHGQPPLFNLFLGIVLKLSGGLEAHVLQWIFLGVSLAMALLVFALMLRLGVPRLLALPLTLGYFMSPSLVLHENLPFYTLPVALLLVASMHLLLQSMQTGRTRYWVGTYLTMALIAGIRSSYHLVLLIAVVLYMVVAAPASMRRKHLWSAVPAFLLASSFYVKNLVLYGRFETSSWLGMNLWHVTAQSLHPDQRSELVARGEMTVSDLHSFLPLERYPPELWQDTADQCLGPTVLCQTTKSTGSPNFNHLAYFAVSEAFLRDDLYAMRRYPLTVARRALSGVLHYFWPASSWEGVQGNGEHLKGWIGLWNRFVLGEVSVPVRESYPDWSRHAYPVIMGWFGTGLAWGLVALTRSIWRRERYQGSVRMVTGGYAALLVLYGAAVSNALEYGENMRFRLETDALTLVLFAMAVVAITRRLQQGLVQLRGREATQRKQRGYG